jgi:hypothetical protein
MGFFPGNYDSESLGAGSGGGSYFKPQAGNNKIRFLTDAIFGWVYWSAENKPVRSADHPGNNPPGIRIGDDGKAEKVKPFLAAGVWSYADQKLMIWEITQATIMKSLQSVAENEDWGDPKSYDITVTKTGQKLETSYTLAPSPHKPLSAEIIQAMDETPINLSALYAGDNPFDPNSAATMPSVEESPAWTTYKALIAKAGADEAKTEQAINWAIGKMPMREDDIRAYAAFEGIPF